MDLSPEPELFIPIDVPDDRGNLEQGARVLLIAGTEVEWASSALAEARAHGFQGLVALSSDAARALAHEFRPDAILLDLQLPGVGGSTVLEHLKRHPETRHMPVYALSDSAEDRQAALKAGAVAHSLKPLDADALAETLDAVTSFIERRVKNVLIVDDDETERRSIGELIGGEDISITAVGTSQEALEALETRRYDCMVLDLRLPETTGFQLLESLKQDERWRDLPVIIHTGKDLTRREETRLRKYAETVIVKNASSPERLLDETGLFLHRNDARLPADKRRLLEGLHKADAVFEGKKILVVDDDVRNVFALVSALESRGMKVLFAENGKEGLEALRQEPDVDLVLMDIMMPEMDGYEAMRAIREIPEFKRLPIISLTAKAMKGDREKSIASGASDYITKPVDVDQLGSLMRVWLYD